MTKKDLNQDANRAYENLAKVQALNNNPKDDFEWPSFNRERDRIKQTSKNYANESIVDSFKKAYGVKVSKSVVDSNQEYIDLHPGEIVPLYIQEVNKKGVIFKQGNIKENIVCNTNLFQYPRFRDFLPTKPISCKVISCTNNKIVVDPFAGMFDQWIKEHTTNLDLQYNMNLDMSVEVSNLHLVGGGFKGRVRVDTISEFCGKDMYIEAFVPGSQIVLNIERDFESWEGKSTRAFITNYAPKPYATNKNLDMILTCSAKEYLRHQGNKTIISWFCAYCENNQLWKDVQGTTFDGIITGICHTQNKCGAFVEIPSLHITPMIPCSPDELNKYKRGANIQVKVDAFDEPTKWNGLQMEHVIPYVIENNCLKTCNVRLTLKEA